MALPATDLFTAADGTALTTYSSSWTNNHGAFQINTNAVSANLAADDAMAHWNADAFGKDQYAQAVLAGTPTGKNQGPTVRSDASAFTGYAYYGFAGQRQLYKIVASAFTLLGTFLGTVSTGDLLRIEVSGSNISCKNNGTLDTFGVKSDTAITSGSAGIAGFDNFTTFRLDNWEGGNVAVFTDALSNQPYIPYKTKLEVVPYF